MRLRKKVSTGLAVILGSLGFASTAVAHPPTDVYYTNLKARQTLRDICYAQFGSHCFAYAVQNGYINTYHSRIYHGTIQSTGGKRWDYGISFYHDYSVSYWRIYN